MRDTLRANSNPASFHAEAPWQSSTQRKEVDRDPEVHVSRGDDARLAVGLVVEDVLARELLERLHHRPGDEVREGHLAAARALQVVVDDDAVVDHQLRRDGAHAR